MFGSDTFTTETIYFLDLRPKSNLLYAGGSFVLNLLQISDKGFIDKGCYIFQDKISDILLLDFDENICLASLHGKECILLHGSNKIESLILNGGITKLLKFNGNSKYVIYGSNLGSIGLLSTSINSLSSLWEIPTSEKSQVVSLQYGHTLRVRA